MDQRLLGRPDRFLDRMKLVGDVEAGPARLDHLDDSLEMPVGPLQSLDDLGVGLVKAGAFGHTHILSPGRGYIQADSNGCGHTL